MKKLFIFLIVSALTIIAFTLVTANTNNKYVVCKPSGLDHSEPVNVNIKVEKNDQLSIKWCRTSNQTDLKLYTFQNNEFVLIEKGTADQGWNTRIITATQYNVYKDSIWFVEGTPTGSTISMRYGPYFVSWDVYLPQINK